EAYDASKELEPQLSYFLAHREAYQD
ncbi:TPA: HNH endonuclease, partial [Klebsiella pneumoniae]|nr:HNH endonuclease [Klebsiella pneumoniae]